jgi:hypothetical protein
MPLAAQRALLATYTDLDLPLLPPAAVRLPAAYGRPIEALGPAQDAFLTIIPRSDCLV